MLYSLLYKLDLVKIYNNLNKLDLVKLVNETIVEMSSFLTELNRIQIEEKGLRSDGTKMTPLYADVTKQKKRSKSGIGGITSHVTLHDKEGVSSALDINLQNNILSFTLDDITVDGFDLDQHLLEKYGDFTGLTDESLELFLEEFNKRFTPKFWKAILG